MAVFADELITVVLEDLDDQHSVHIGDPGIALRALSRAQQFISIRYGLLRKTVPWNLGPSYPLSPRLDVLSRGVALLSGTVNGVPLVPVPFSQLKHRDVSWLATTGTLPYLFYCCGWSLIGVSPIPTTPLSVLLTFLVVSLPLTTMTQQLETPDSFADNIIQVCTGLLLLGQERLTQEGLARIKEGLGGTVPTSLATRTARV